MRSSYTWTMKPWLRSEWRLGFNSVLENSWRMPTSLGKPQKANTQCVVYSINQNYAIQLNELKLVFAVVIIKCFLFCFIFQVHQATFSVSRWALAPRPCTSGEFGPQMKGSTHVRWRLIHRPLLSPLSVSTFNYTLLFLWLLTHSERRPQNKYSLEEKTSILLSNWQHKFLYFHYKSKLGVLCIWTFGPPFRCKTLPICTQNSDLQSLFMLSIWGFTDYFAWNNSYEPSQHLHVTWTKLSSFWCIHVIQNF